jgi:hypothetical protein
MVNICRLEAQGADTIANHQLVPHLGAPCPEVLDPRFLTDVALPARDPGPSGLTRKPLFTLPNQFPTLFIVSCSPDLFVAQRH